MKHETKEKLIVVFAYPAFFAYIILCFIMCRYLSSCHTEKRISNKAIQKMRKAEQKYNAKSNVDTAGNNYCYTYHPVKAQTVTKTITKQGRTITKTTHDTVTVDCDTIRSVVRIPCPPARHTVRIDTVTVHDSTTVLDSRALGLCEAKVRGLQEAVGKADKKADNYLRLSLLGLLGWLLLSVMVVIKIKPRL